MRSWITHDLRIWLTRVIAFLAVCLEAYAIVILNSDIQAACVKASKPEIHSIDTVDI